MLPKVILVLVNDRRQVAATLDRASAYARRFGAGLIALHVRPDSVALMAQVDGQYFATMAASVFETIEREAMESAKAVKAALENWCASNSDVQVTWRDAVGSLEDIVAHEGQLADLIVVGRPPAKEAPLDELALEAALFGTGRPVLLLPLDQKVSIGGTAVMAWNASLESTRALSAGLAFLQTASKTLVVTFGEQAAHEAKASDVVPYLGAHGVQAEARQISELFAPAGRMILDLASQAGADLLVMGAYTHSRVRQLLLGGATRDVLRSAPIPVLMAH